MPKKDDRIVNAKERVKKGSEMPREGQKDLLHQSMYERISYAKGLVVRFLNAETRMKGSPMPSDGWKVTQHQGRKEGSPMTRDTRKNFVCRGKGLIEGYLITRDGSPLPREGQQDHHCQGRGGRICNVTRMMEGSQCQEKALRISNVRGWIEKSAKPREGRKDLHCQEEDKKISNVKG
jgi:hypothetical protein